MSEPSNLSLLGYVVAFIAAGGLLGYGRYLLEWRRAPADRGYVVAQTDEVRARIRREDESAAVAGLKELAQGLRDERDYWKRETDYWKARAEKAERRPLEEELKRLPEPPAEH